MAAIKALAEIARKFTEVTPQRATEYQAGVENPRRDWAANTAAAEDSYKQGVTAAANAGRFGQGVRRAGNAKWQQGAVQKGAIRYGPGVQVAGEAYQQGFAPYHQAISSLTLPGRYPRRDARNLQRVQAVVQALSRVKEQGR